MQSTQIRGRRKLSGWWHTAIWVTWVIVAMIAGVDASNSFATGNNGDIGVLGWLPWVLLIVAIIASAWIHEHNRNIGRVNAMQAQEEAWKQQQAWEWKQEAMYQHATYDQRVAWAELVSNYKTLHNRLYAYLQSAGVGLTPDEILNIVQAILPNIAYDDWNIARVISSYNEQEALKQLENALSFKMVPVEPANLTIHRFLTRAREAIEARQLIAKTVPVRFLMDYEKREQDEYNKEQQTLQEQQEETEQATQNPRYINRAVMTEVWNRDRGKCVRCGSQQALEFDHIIPVSLGGSSTTQNVQLLCQTCNRSKGNREIG